ncbi:MAG: helix-turn-helix domain-containing protein [Spirochaetes bacterium]|nr:helix-turn-helix domain-containing protein [Spirochaetota bacterium]
MLSSLNVKIFQVKSPILKPLIKYFWIIDEKNQNICHKFLPVSNIDLVLNLGHPAKYIAANGESVVAHKLFLNGITEEYKWCVHKGTVKMLGISFYSTGLYPILKIPISNLRNQTTELDNIHKRLYLEIVDKIQRFTHLEHQLNILENIILKYVDVNKLLDKQFSKLLNHFNNDITTTTIENFCFDQGIHKRTLERFFQKNIGTPPKAYAKIKRFQNIIRQLETKTFHTLTDLAYANHFYDQMHFIKDFKAFTGSTPTDFVRQKSSLRDLVFN